MNDVTGTPADHEPTPEFRAALEEEMIRAFRRESQFAPSPSAVRRWPLAGLAAIAATAVLMLGVGLVWGVGTGFAAAQIQDGTKRAEPLPLAVFRATPVRKAITALSCNAPAAPPAQAAAAAPQGVPILDLPAPTRVTSGTFGAVLGVRQLSTGNVLVNDAGRRQLKVLDSALAELGVALDSVPGSANSYGTRPMPLIRYLGDSSVTSDVNAATLLVVGPDGRIARAMSAPDADMPLYMRIGFSGIDDKGRILYKSRPLTMLQARAQGFRGPPGGLPGVYAGDSALVLRADLESRRVDTIARVKIRASTMMVRQQGGPMRFASEPAPTLDEWAVLSDGSIAIVRGQDYHVDWIRADGTRHSTTKLPFDWKRLSDEDKQRLIDSVRADLGAQLSVPRDRPSAGSGGGGSGARGGRGDVPPDNGPPRPPIATEYVPPSLRDIPDYYPPLRDGALFPDLDGNLWILPTSSAQSRNGELVYDVVNVRGEFRRVRLPLGRSIAGFGKGGVVYLQAGDKARGFHLERTRLPGGGRP